MRADEASGSEGSVSDHGALVGLVGALAVSQYWFRSVVFSNWVFACVFWLILSAFLAVLRVFSGWF